MKTAIALIALTLAACGELKEAMAPKATPTPTPVADSVTFQGSAQYAFEITVDGQKFNDIEDYYTEQALTLKDKVIAAGYNADSVEFIGELGFDDFIKDMTVFVSSSTGTQGKTEIDNQGNFSVDVANPNQDKKVTFKVRATKRVQVIVSLAGTVTNKLCYNFSAVEQDIIENPIALSTFETSRTLYDCEQVSEGMVIPPAAATPAAARTLSLDASVEAVWTKPNSNEFFVDTATERQLFLLPRNGSKPVAVGTPESYSADPVGYDRLVNTYEVASSSPAFNTSRVPFGSETILIKGTSDWTEVSVISGNVVIKSFTIPTYGIYSVAVSGSKLMAVARVDGNNEWAAGTIDMRTNRFIPGAKSELSSDSVAGLVDGVFTVVAGNKVQFFSL